jgi:hypothetical protein
MLVELIKQSRPRNVSLLFTAELPVESSRIFRTNWFKVEVNHLINQLGIIFLKDLLRPLRRLSHTLTLRQ